MGASNNTLPSRGTTGRETAAGAPIHPRGAIELFEQRVIFAKHAPIMERER
jgi:hypothetical protein